MSENTLPDFSEFMYPSQEIRQSIEDLIIYMQFHNRDAVEAYLKFKDKDYFKGTLGQWAGKDFYTEVFERAKGKPWESLYRTSKLLKEYQTTWDLKNLNTLTENEQWELLSVVRKGIEAHKKLREWYLPILKPEPVPNDFYDSYDAMDDVIRNIGIGGKYSTFQLMKVADVNSHPYKEGGIAFLDSIIELEHPGDMATYLANYYPNPTDSLILTYVRSKTYGWKASIYLFLIYKKVLYVLDGSDHRLNQMNTAGARGGYMRNMEHVWLPWNIILAENDKPTTAIVLRNRKAFKRGSLQEVFKTARPIWIWMSLLVYILQDIIDNPPEDLKIEQTYTVDHLPMLPDKLTSIPNEETMEWAHYFGEPKNDYLVRIYQKDITDIAPIEDINNLPVIGTEKHLTEIISYERRRQFAESLQQKVNEDWENSREEIRKWFSEFCQKIDLEWFITKALKDEEYEYTTYAGIPDKHSFGSQKRRTKAKVLGHQLVEGMMTSHYMNVRESNYVFSNIPIIERKRDEIYSLQYEANLTNNKDDTCYICKQNKWTNLLITSYVDVEQFCGFFEISPDSIPQKVREHWNRKRDVYTGNSILDDLDAVNDEVTDPFPSSYTISIKLCSSCEKKYMGNLWLRQRRHDQSEGWMSGYRSNSKLHYYIGTLSICGDAPPIRNFYYSEYRGHHTPCPKCLKRFNERKKAFPDLKLGDPE